MDWDADLSDFYDPTQSEEGVEKIFVLDGQQRLQTLYALLKGGIKAPDGSTKLAPFNVKFKGNEPHIDHIYPQSPLRKQLSLTSAEINDIGNFSFIGAYNLRKRAELPASYFGRLKTAGTDIEKHLLLPDASLDPSKLVFNAPTYASFRDRRHDEIWNIANRVVNP